MIRLLTVLFLVTACGEFHEKDQPTATRDIPGEEGPAGKDASPCSVVQHSDGATISCPDGTVAEIYHGNDGQDGEDGAQGEAGQDGSDGTDGVDNTSPIYVGYYCSRTVLLIGGIHYVIHGALVPLNSAWLKVSNSCEIRLHKRTIKTRNPSS